MIVTAMKQRAPLSGLPYHAGTDATFWAIIVRDDVTGWRIAGWLDRRRRSARGAYFYEAFGTDDVIEFYGGEEITSTPLGEFGGCRKATDAVVEWAGLRAQRIDKPL